LLSLACSLHQPTREDLFLLQDIKSRLLKWNIGGHVQKNDGKHDEVARLAQKPDLWINLRLLLNSVQRLNG
jgi:hypothetical protein